MADSPRTTHCRGSAFLERNHNTHSRAETGSILNPVHHMTIRVFIICCHTTPHTKGGVLAEAITGALERVGIAYRLSDLAASRFNPIAGPLDFLPTLPFQPSYRASQKLAVRCDGFATDIRIEQDNLMWADHVVFIFPIWFFGMPAVLKGWVERVLARGFAYGGTMEYGTGGMAGKTVHALITAAADRDDYTEYGKHIPLDLLLQACFDLPMRYVGFELGVREVLCAVEKDTADDFALRAKHEAQKLAVLISLNTRGRKHTNGSPSQG